MLLYWFINYAENNLKKIPYSYSIDIFVMDLSKEHLLGVIEALQTRLETITEQKLCASKKYRGSHKTQIQDYAKKYYAENKKNLSWIHKRQESQRTHYRRKKFLKALSCYCDLTSSETRLSQKSEVPPAQK